MPAIAPVRADLRQILLTVTGIPTAIAWEGRQFIPSAGVRWLAERLTPVQSSPASLGNEGFTRDWMNYHITLNSPPLTVPLSDDENLIDAILYAYPTGREVGGVNVNGRTVRTMRSGFSTNAEWRTITASIGLWVLRSTQVNPVV
jgi:hypothetical protein